MPKDNIYTNTDQAGQLNLTNLADIEAYGQLGVWILDIERSNRFSEATKLYNLLQNYFEKHKDFEVNYPEMAKKYQDLVVWLKFITLHLLSDEELFGLLKNHLIEGIRLDIDIREKLKTMFKYSWDPFILGNKCNLVVKAISQNNERLGNYKIKAGVDGREMLLTINMLILDYNRFSKEGERRGGLEEAYYLGHSQEAQKFSPNDRDLALKILQIYDFVRFPPLDKLISEMKVSPFRTVSAPAMPLPKRGLPQTPLVSPLEKIKETTQATVSYAKLQKTYNNYKTQIPLYQGLENKLLEKTQGQLMGIKEELVLALKAGDKNQVIAALRILAKQGILGNILKDSPLWQKTIIEYIKNKYATQLSQVELNQLIKNFPRLSNAPAVFSEFLQYLLKARLKLSENESALVCVDIIDIFNQKGENKFAGIITGNADIGEFEWARNRVVDGELVSEVG